MFQSISFSDTKKHIRERLLKDVNACFGESNVLCSFSKTLTADIQGIFPNQTTTVAADPTAYSLDKKQAVERRLPGTCSFAIGFRVRAPNVFVTHLGWRLKNADNDWTRTMNQHDAIGEAFGKCICSPAGFLMDFSQLDFSQDLWTHCIFEQWIAHC